MTNRMWVTLLYCSLINHLSHPTWPTVCEWHCFIAFSSIMSHPMINSTQMWVTLLYCGSLINHASSHDQQYVSDTALLWSHQSCLIPWPTECEWHCFKLQSHQSCLILWPTVCEWHCFIAVSSIMSHPLTNREWVTLTALLQSHQSCLIPWPTVCEWHCFIAVSSIMSHPMTNRQ